jgi:hypothetical protein
MGIADSRQELKYFERNLIIDGKEAETKALLR